MMFSVLQKKTELFVTSSLQIHTCVQLYKIYPKRRKSMKLIISCLYEIISYHVQFVFTLKNYINHKLNTFFLEA